MTSRASGVSKQCIVLMSAVLFAACSHRAGSNTPGGASLQEAVSKTPCVVQADLPGIERVAPGASHAGQMGAGSNAGGLLGGELGGQTEASPTPSPTGSPNQPCVDPEVGDMIADLTAMGNAVPAAEIDVGARAQALPPDAPSVFAFVRDIVRLDVYAGAMRGPLGTLMGLAGNPTDKALLLAQLLRDKGMQVRFARGTLSSDEIRKLSDLVRAPTQAASPEPLVNPIATPKGYDETQVDKAVQAQRDAYEKQMHDDIAGAQAEAGKLADVLAARNVTLGAGAQADWAAMLRTHYWVQVQQGGAWVDLDPSSPDMVVGKHLGAVDTSSSASAIPDDQYVTVSITLLQDGGANGQTAPTTVLSVQRNAADLFAQRIQLLIGPSDKNAKIVGAATLVPALTIGQDVTTGTAIDVGSGSQLQKLRLEIAVATPGQPARTYRRVLFDRATADQSAGAVAYGVAGVYEFLVVPAELNGTFEAQKTLIEMVNQQAAYAWTDAAVRGTAGDRLPKIHPEEFPIELLEYARRDWIFAQQLAAAQSKPVRFFYDRPDIIMLHRGYHAAGGKTSAVIAYDIFDNGMGVVADDAALAARSNLARGYMDTTLEHRTLAAGPAIDTIKVMAAADKGGIARTVVLPGAVQAAQGLSLTASAQANLQATLDAGQVAIIPERAVTVDGQQEIGWWAIDPRSGNAVGRMSTGGGQALTETVIEEANVVYTEAEILEYYNSIFSCIAHGVTAPLAGKEEGEAAGHEFVSCMALAMCKMGASLLIDEYIEEHHSFIVAIYKPLAFHYELGHPALCGAVLGEGGGEGGGGGE